MDAGNVLEIKDLVVGYDAHPILDGVSLTVESHDFVGVIGPNGGGKTTLLKAIVGLLKPYSGTISFGTDKPLGYLPQLNQQDRLFPISVEEVVLSGLFGRRGVLGRYTSSDRADARRWMSEAGILSLARERFGNLSGGQRQRALLCRALCSDPDLLLLDEPNTFVDNRFEGELYNILKEQNQHRTILVVTHDVGTVAQCVKSVVCVNRSLHHHPANRVTPDLLKAYDCPIQLVTHGEVPHTVLCNHA